MSLHAKLLAVMKEVRSLKKRGHNSEQGYAYVTEADTVTALRRALVKRDVLVIPRVLNQSQQGFLVMVTMTFTFVDVDTNETLVCEWAGAASDKHDKAIWKAITGAQKYLLLKLFMIPTFDDPERDSPSHESTVAVSAPESPVLIDSVTTKGRTSTLKLSDGRKVVVFQPQLAALAEQRSQDKIMVLVKCEGEWRGKAKCIGIEDAEPKGALWNPEVPAVSTEDAVL